MTDLIKLLCGYLKNGTDDQKAMAEETLLFVYKEKSKEIFLEQFPLRFEDIAFRNDCKKFAEYYAGCDTYEKDVFYGKYILTCPYGLYEVHWKEGGHKYSVSLASIGGFDSGKRWIAPCNWTQQEHYHTTRTRLIDIANEIEKLVLIRKA